MKNDKLLKRIFATFNTLLIAAPNLNGILAYASENEVFQCGDLDITYTVTSEWDSCKNIQLCISNPTDSPVYRWAFQYDAGGIINDIWNADIIENSGTQYVIENKSYNNYIAPHSYQLIGHTVENNDGGSELTGFTDCVENTDIDSGFEVDSYIFEDMPESGNGVIAITNMTNQPFYGWNISFNSNTPLSNCHNSVLEKKDENSYVISCTEWNSIIDPGCTLEINVSAIFDENENFQLNDVSLKVDSLKYGFNELIPPNEEFQLNGFSKYGVNVLSWDYSESASFDIYRKIDDKFVCIGNTENTMYFFDTDVEPDSLYEYYVAVKDDKKESSNTITINTPVDSEETITEFPQWLNDMMLLEEDCAELKIEYGKGESRNYVSRKLNLPANGVNGSIVSWKSNDPKIISESGDVTPPYSESFTPVTLTAFLSYNDFSMSKSFELNVAPKASTEKPEPLGYEELSALNDGNLPKMIYNAANGTVSKIEGVCSSIPVFTSESALTVISSLSNILGIENAEEQLEFVNYQGSSVNNVFYFRQLYKGIPVVGYTVCVYADPSTGIVKRISNQFQPLLELDTVVPVITDEAAIDIVINEFNSETTSVPELVIFYPAVENTIPTSVLAWQLSTDSVDATDVVIDAITGEILEADGQQSIVSPQTYSEKNDLLNKRITVNTAYVFEYSKEDKKLYKGYTLRDVPRNITVYDDKSEIDHKESEEYYRKDNNWSDEQYDTALATEYHVAAAYDYFKDTFDWKGFDNKNSNMKIHINYAEKNTLGGGINTHVNNAYSSNDHLSFGTGDNISCRNLAASLDCVAHEYTHSVTYNQFKSKFGSTLPYQGESGAINEAYSDIFGEFVDPKYDWLHGNDYHIDGKAERYLKYPAVKEYRGEGWKDTSATGKLSDYGGTHTNCTVISYAAYLMSVYNSDTGLPGIPKKDLEQIWFESYCHYSKSAVNFVSCRDAVEEAVNDLYGSTSDYAKKVSEAFDAVGIRRDDITVRVEDALTGDAVKDAKVSLQCSAFAPGTSPYSYAYSDSHGEAHFSNILNADKLTFKVTHDSYKTLSNNVEADAVTEYYNLYLESEYTNTLKGSITIADSDSDITNNVPVSGAIVRLEKLSGTEKFTENSNTLSLDTDKDGKYEFSDIPLGKYNLNIFKLGHIPVNLKINVEDAVTIYDTAIDLIPTTDSKTESEYGYGSGFITDAKTGEGVSGLTLHIYRGLYLNANEPDDAECMDTISTDSNGKYITPALLEGKYTVFVIDEREGVSESDRYMNTSFSLDIKKECVTGNQNSTVSRVIRNEKLRIVLKWGSEPKDLDSYTLIYTNGGTKRSCLYFENMKYVIDGKTVAYLSFDDRSSYGPETTTIDMSDVDRIEFYVNDFTNYSLGSLNTELGNSGAEVAVYVDNSVTPIEVFSVPSGNGTFWKVFFYNSTTHELIPYNTLSSYMR